MPAWGLKFEFCPFHDSGAKPPLEIVNWTPSIYVVQPSSMMGPLWAGEDRWRP